MWLDIGKWWTSTMKNNNKNKFLDRYHLFQLFILPPVHTNLHLLYELYEAQGIGLDEAQVLCMGNLHFRC